MEENYETGVNIFPTELWINIAKKMEIVYDLENLCLAFEKLRPFLESHLTKLKHKTVIMLTLQSGFINSNVGLKMREVSKDWFSIMDGYYNKPHAYHTCLPQHYFPCTTLKVPIDINEVTRVEELGKHDNCNFVGGRLTLLLSKTKEPICSNIVNETVRSVCARVAHLTIKMYIDDDDDDHEDDDEDTFTDKEIQDICAPFIRQMWNLTSITCDLDMDVELILLLPNPSKLEVIKTRHYGALRDNSDDWDRAFAGCKSNLKIFDCIVYTRGMRTALSHFTFDNLLELRAAEHYYDIPDDEWYTEDGSRHLFDLNKACAKQRFPKLKRIAIQFFGGSYRGICGKNRWVFLERMMQVTDNIDTLEEIEVRPGFMWENLSLDLFPVRQEIVESVGTNVRRLVFRIRFFPETFEWCLRVSSLWPSVRSFRIGQREYVRIRNEWILVGIQPKCTECF